MISIDGDAQEFLQKLMQISPDLANDALDRVGARLRKQLIEKSRMYGEIPFGTKFNRVGKRILTGTKQGVFKSAFSMKSHQTLRPYGSGNFADLTRARTYYKSHTLLVGWFATKTYRQKKFRKGQEVMGEELAPVAGLGKGINDIGDLIENGGIQELSNRQKGLFKASGWGKAAKRGYIGRTARPLVSIASLSMVNKTFKDYYTEALNGFKKAM